MKRSRDIFGILKKNSKLLADNIKTLCQRQNMEDIFFSSSHDMAEDVGSDGKLLKKQDCLMERWTIIGESGLVQLLINAYKKMTLHQF